MNIKKLFFIFLIIFQPIRTVSYEQTNKPDYELLMVLGVCGAIYTSLIVTIVYKYLHYWDYSKQKSNSQKLDFLLTSHKHAAQIKDLINYLHDPSKYVEKRQNYLKGILFSGGMGSLIVQALSNELGGQCFYIDVIDFIGKYEIHYLSGRINNLKQSAGNVTSFFNYIKRQKIPCLIVFKNIECLIPQTFSYENIQLENYINEEIEAINNQLLIEIKKLESHNDVIVCSAIISDFKILPTMLNSAFTNVLDNSYPLAVRTIIIDYFFKAILKYTNVSSYDLALKTSKFTAEQLISLREQIMNSIAVKNDKMNIKTASEIIDDVAYGKVQDNNESELTAYHESGHAMIMMLFNTQYALYKVSILSRDNHLGITQSFREEPDMIYNEEKTLNEICMCLAGYAGEEMFLSKNTMNTESTDYKEAYNLACIVADKIKNSDPKKIIDQEYARALKILKQYKIQFTVLAQALIEHKVLMSDEIYQLFDKIQ